MSYVVEIDSGVWLANIEGDPGRTLQKRYAQKFKRFQDATRALYAARRTRDLPNARIVQWGVKTGEGVEC